MTATLLRLGAVVRRESLEIGRRRTPYVLRTVYAALVGLCVFGFMWVAVSAGSRGEVTGSGLGILAYFTYGVAVAGQCVALLVLASVLGVSSAMAERSQRTLGLLLLSRLRYGEIVAGKLIALLAQVAMVAAAALPVFGILGWAGGLDYSWLARSGGLLLTLTLLGLSVGLAAGIGCRRPLVAHVGSVLLLLAVILVPAWYVARSAAVANAAFANAPLAARALRVWIPGAISQATTQGLSGEGFGHTLLATVAIAVGFAGIATLGLRRAVGHTAGGGLRGGFERLDRVFDRINLGNVRLFANWSDRFTGGNPVTWMTSTATGFGLGRYGARLGIASFGGALTIGSLAVVGSTWAVVLSMLAVPALLLVPLASGATAIAAERGRKSLAPLLATPLDARTILAGKAWSALKLLALVGLPPLGVVLLFEGIGAWAYMGLVATEAGLLLLLLFVTEAAAVFVLAMTVSLTARTPLRAGIAASGLLVAINAAPAVIGVAVRGARDGHTASWVAVTIAFGGAALLVAHWLLRRRESLGWALGCLVTVSTLGAALLVGFLLLPLFDYNQEVDAWRSIVGLGAGYLLLTTLLVWLLVVHRFDDALGRST